MRFTRNCLNNIRVNELSDFLHVIYPFLDTLGPLNPKLKLALVGLSDVSKELDAALPKTNLKGETRSVNEIDDYRDGEYLTFRTFIEAFTHSRNATTREQALLIHDTLKANGYTLNSLPLKEESTTIRTLNGLFSTGRHAEAMAGLSAQPLWQNVMVAQEEFDTAAGIRSKLAVAEDAGEAAHVVAKRAKTQCTEVFELIEALYKIEGKAEYADAIGKVNHEADAVIALIRTRETLAKKKKEEEEKKKKEEEEKKKGTK
ncbi:DUF6261 family protein [uncultured Acetobacteroides sp.]|uniref:DUF6261 family protein n=1 Tax=uncultured Acetobacteroides sp. TaxID=1760811 RepID=UPI0029F5641A|nr:DUF6261 family protein [uncultured Acetobacteroides sp.]